MKAPFWPTRAHGFFSACGGFFFRFLRLAAVQWVVYAMLFGFVHRSLFDRFYPYVTRDLTVERTAFSIRVALYLVFGIALAAFNLVFDYAKVRERRRKPPEDDDTPPELTPLDIERRFGLSEGNIFQGELTLEQLFFLRPVPGWARYRTPVQRRRSPRAGSLLAPVQARPG